MKTLFPMVSKFPWSHMKLFSKYAVKRPLTLKSCLHTNICNGTIGIFQKRTGIVKSHLIDIFDKICMKRVLK